MKRKWLKYTMLLLSIGVLGIVSYYTYSIIQFSNHISTAVKPAEETDSAHNEVVEIPKWEGKERINILLIGGDSRGDDAGRSDTMLVASIDPVTKRAHLFSLLRDTYVEIPGHGKGRLNSAFAYGGIELTRQTIGDLLDLPIHKYVYTDFVGFIALVDSLGGVDIEVEKDMYYTSKADKHMYDIDLKQGLQHLDGKMALQYVRFRHDAKSDFARTERQRILMTEVAKKMQTTNSLIKLPGILDSIAPYIETDLSPKEMLKLMALGFDVNLDKIDQQQLPPFSLLSNEKVGRAQVLGVDKNKLQAYVKQLFENDTLQ
ncbi:LytR family transcriptional regulator [Paenibacillus glucanolyticus]|jgi:LCP family protein required for cell wall assembly|uniref:LCP family protein n=1 Tax=Paenibacillus TaxID=44249 RepID=UPI0003E1CA93|nr:MULTISPECIES: LCP family protein [Paenibacillus]ANA81111.1 transcriptional regulator [Paenibacillus glucanolyticus]AVV54771.1 LytR family transcriptional regulator [Paenibacillus glucanolyticus]ETT33722.1 cell envelope-like transcriptional attenuator [Paenibacillus sp. FSL R5-808]MPY18946.1 LytR family transcriptional regulator [Paenibacillus glucanolyticus]OMF74392.1 transcriptional regulator [Paenibacillus glucanolyticus]